MLVVKAMECSVCYDSCAGCHLVCGHSFCHGCVRKWYESSPEPTCPMCRGNLYFRGMRKCVDKWDEEADEKERAEIWGELVDELLECGCDMEELEWAEERFKYCDDVDIILDDDIDFIVETIRKRRFHDPFTWRFLLFVTKHRSNRGPFCKSRIPLGMCAL